LTKVARNRRRVFLNTNDFDRAIVESVADSTLSTSWLLPSHKQMDGKFHNDQVKVAGDG